MREIDFCEPSIVSETTLLTFDMFLFGSLFFEIVTTDPGDCCSETLDKCFLWIFDKNMTFEPGFDSISFLRRIKSCKDDVAGPTSTFGIFEFD